MNKMDWKEGKRGGYAGLLCVLVSSFFIATIFLGSNIIGIMESQEQTMKNQLSIVFIFLSVFTNWVFIGYSSHGMLVKKDD